MSLEIKRAVRRALPLQIAFYGPSGSGKTMSALLFAAGLAGGGKVVVIDTERGRASLYSDNKRVTEALPQGYDVLELDQPYHPQRYIEALDLCEAGGYKVCLVDSESDSWDGPGGCTDITEANKGRWNKAKLWNKRMKTRMALSDMHILSLFKAQEKSKIIQGPVKNGKVTEEVVSLGILPISEKNAFYPFLLGFSVDPKTHISTAVKYHEDLGHIFAEPKLITRDDGARVRVWNESGAAIGDADQLRKRALASAEGGMAEYKAFFATLTAAQKKALGDAHNEAKAIAEKADSEIPTVDKLPDPVEQVEGSLLRWNGKVWAVQDSEEGFKWQETGA